MQNRVSRLFNQRMHCLCGMDVDVSDKAAAVEGQTFRSRTVARPWGKSSPGLEGGGGVDSCLATLPSGTAR